MPAGRDRRVRKAGGEDLPAPARRRLQALLVIPVVLIFALGMLVPVVASSRSGSAGAARSKKACTVPGTNIFTICEATEPTTTEPTTTTAPTTTTEPTTPTTPTTPVVHELVPLLGRSAVATPLRGIVRFRAPGSTRFVKLSGRRLIPIGSDVDTRGGTVAITSAAVHGTQTGAFHSGMFKLEQPLASAARAGKTRVLTVLHLIGGSFRGCEADEDNAHAVIASAARRPSQATAFAARRRRHRVVRRLWGSDGGGGWGTVGSQAAGTVLGTVWMTEDNCLGTYVLVKRGVVDVHDFLTGETVRVRAGHHYLARAPDPA